MQLVRQTPRFLGMVVLLGFCGFFLLPIVWLLLATTKSDLALQTHSSLSFGSIHGVAVAWKHLIAFNDGAMLLWMRNSAFYSGVAVLITLAVSLPAGYAMGLTEFRGRKLLLATTLIVMILPGSALVLPIFLEMNAVHLVGTSWSVILPYAFYPFGVYLAYIYFATAVPRELLEAARIDGAHEWQVFTRVALPLAKPITILIGFFCFFDTWNNFFLPFVMLGDSSRYPLSVGLNELLTSTPSFNPANGGLQSHIARPELALATVVAAAPVIVVLMVVQRGLVRGMTAGATVG
jgi:multiple sugar transport system permease protein